MSNEKPKSELLREGCRSYHQAMFAAAEFRRRIHKLIRQALKRHAAELAQATKLDKRVFLDEIKELADPKDTGPDAEVGVRIPKRTKTWRLRVYLYLADPPTDYPAPALYAEIWLKTRGRLRERLDGLRDQVTLDGDQLAWQSEPISVDQSFDLDRSLDKLLDRWISLWREAGGIRQLTSDTIEPKS